MIVALVSCSGPKLTSPSPARDLYQSDLFKKARAYAERHADAWAILSAQHGVVLPDQVIAPYDRSVKDISRRTRGHVASGTTWSEIERWRAEMHRQLHDLFPQAARFLFLAGDDYDCALGWHGPRRLEVRCTLAFDRPLEGMQIGERKRWLKAALAEGVAA